MTESGNPKDNPEAERINNTLKNELFKDKEFHDIGEVREAMQAAVPFYNNERPHRSIEMLTPIEAAGRTGRFKRGWTSYREKAIDNLDRETLPP
jgi:transposase InsO family protein